MGGADLYGWSDGRLGASPHLCAAYPISRSTSSPDVNDVMATNSAIDSFPYFASLFRDVPIAVVAATFEKVLNELAAITYALPLTEMCAFDDSNLPRIMEYDVTPAAVSAEYEVAPAVIIIFALLSTTSDTEVSVVRLFDVIIPPGSA